MNEIKEYTEKIFEDSKIYRTDQDGSILIKLKNPKIKIKTI